MNPKTNLYRQPLFAFCAPVLLPFFLFFFLSFSAASQGNLLITPKRVVFDGNKRAEDLNLVNVGQDSATYVLSFIHFRMKEDGGFERIETPDSGQYFAEQYLRIFPRTVTLAPNETQTIKLQVRRPADLQSGEYRSHLYFRAVPKQAPLGANSTGTDSSISVKLTPIFGISIPVIVRAGEADTQIQLANINFQTDSIPVMGITLQRKGNMSSYGDITVNHISKQGKVTPVGLARGLAVYTPNQERSFRLQLDPARKVNYHSGKLQVTYTNQSAKPVVLAEKEFVLQ